MYVVATLGVVHISRLKTCGNARRAAFSFFPKRSGGCAPEAFVVAKQPSAALSVTRRTFRHMTCGALAAFWKVEMFLSRRAWKKTSPSLPLCARIPRVYIWNNKLERAKDAIFEQPLTLQPPQYDVNLKKCALLKCLCGSAFAARQAPVRSLALKISVIFGHTDKRSLIHLSNL